MWSSRSHSLVNFALQKVMGRRKDARSIFRPVVSIQCYVKHRDSLDESKNVEGSIHIEGDTEILEEYLVQVDL